MIRIIPFQANSSGHQGHVQLTQVSFSVVFAVFFVGNVGESLAAAEVPVRVAQHVETTVEVEGELRLNASGKGVQSVSITASAGVVYDEMRVSGGPADRWIRRYRRAESQAKPGAGRIELALRPNRTLIICDVEGRRPTLRSPQGPLTRDELDVLQLQFSSVIVHDLVPLFLQASDKPREVMLDKNLLSGLLGLDVVLEQDLVVSRAGGRQKETMVSLNGSVDGLVGGVSAATEINGEFFCDLIAGRVRRLDVKITEERSIGHATPGFRLAARVRTAITGVDESFADECEAIASQFQQEELPAMLEHKSEAGRFRFLHDRSWHVLADRHDVTILRRIDGGDLIAQCNISRLAPLEEGKQLALEAFQESIKSGLGERFGQFVEARKEDFGESGRQLRVVVLGESSKLPVQWHYVHLTRSDGERCSMVFTLESSQASRFGDADGQIVSSFEILDRKVGSPTPAGVGARTANAKEDGRRQSME